MNRRTHGVVRRSMTVSRDPLRCAAGPIARLRFVVRELHPSIRAWAGSRSANAKVILDGAGTKWAPELASEEHKYHRLFDEVRDDAGACVYCARAYGVKEGVEAAGVGLIDEFKGHPSVRRLIADGYEVVTF
jgi:hypothetical protein